jgi:quercetin dioxygenase-like cupin family protein
LEKEVSVDNGPVPAVLADLVVYQEDSMVSKTLIKEKTGTITLFAFAQGEESSEHTAPYDAMVYVLDGTVDISISGQPVQLTSGQMVIMPVNVPHALKANVPFKMILTMIRS